MILALAMMLDGPLHGTCMVMWTCVIWVCLLVVLIPHFTGVSCAVMVLNTLLGFFS